MAQKVKCLSTMRETRVQSLVWEDPLEKEMAIHSSTIAWKFHGQRSLVGYSLWGCKELDMTAAAAAAKSLQLCPTLCDPIDGRPPGSSVHEIFQTRILV